jgi:hypothetical protein
MQESLTSASVYLKFLTCKGENLAARISKIREKWYRLNHGLYKVKWSHWYFFSLVWYSFKGYTRYSFTFFKNISVCVSRILMKYFQTHIQRETEISQANLSKNYVSYEERVVRRFQNIYFRDNGALWRVLSTLKYLKSLKHWGNVGHSGSVWNGRRNSEIESRKEQRDKI